MYTVSAIPCNSISCHAIPCNSMLNATLFHATECYAMSCNVMLRSLSFSVKCSRHVLLRRQLSSHQSYLPTTTCCRHSVLVDLPLQARMLLTSTSEVYGDPLVHPQPETYWGNVNPIGLRSCYDEGTWVLQFVSAVPLTATNARCCCLHDTFFESTVVSLAAVASCSPVVVMCMCVRVCCAGKRVAETTCMAYKLEGFVDIRIARIFNTFGPRMHPDDGRVVSNFITQVCVRASIQPCSNASTLPYYHIHSYYHATILPYYQHYHHNHAFVLPCYHTTLLPYYHTTVQPYNHTAVQPYYIQPYSHTTIQPCILCSVCSVCHAPL
jgi:hypothetical protein